MNAGLSNYVAIGYVRGKMNECIVGELGNREREGERERERGKEWERKCAD